MPTGRFRSECARQPGDAITGDKQIPVSIVRRSAKVCAACPLFEDELQLILFLVLVLENERSFP